MAVASKMIYNLSMLQKYPSKALEKKYYWTIRSDYNIY